MHPNPIYRQTPADRNLAFAAERGFGNLCVNGPAGPLVSHIPFVLTSDTTAELHLVRSNPIARLGECPAVIAVTGADAYISPDWYGIDDQVPTWNYVAVHLRGRLVPLAHDELPGALERLSHTFESRLAPKPVWTMDKMTEDTRTRFLRMIVPFRFDIDSVEGTWKLGQNKSAEARAGAAQGVTDAKIGVQTDELASLMRAVDTGDTGS